MQQQSVMDDTGSPVNGDSLRRTEMLNDIREAQTRLRLQRLRKLLPLAMAQVEDRGLWDVDVSFIDGRMRKGGTRNLIVERCVYNMLPIEWTEYMRSERLVAYTDGSFSPGSHTRSGLPTGGFSFVVMDSQNNMVMHGGGVLAAGVRNSAECEYAAVHALLHSLPEGTDVRVRTDLLAIIDMAANKGREVFLYEDLVARHADVSFEKVRGHHLSLGNHIADSIAKSYRKLHDNQLTEALIESPAYKLSF